jgi:hypothetical protein
MQKQSIKQIKSAIAKLDEEIKIVNKSIEHNQTLLCYVNNEIVEVYARHGFIYAEHKAYTFNSSISFSDYFDIYGAVQLEAHYLVLKSLGFYEVLEPLYKTCTELMMRRSDLQDEILFGDYDDDDYDDSENDDDYDSDDYYEDHETTAFDSRFSNWRLDDDYYYDPDLDDPWLFNIEQAEIDRGFKASLTPESRVNARKFLGDLRRQLLESNHE